MSYFNPSGRGCLCEALTFDQLFRLSEPKRILRSKTVSGPPLEVNANTTGEAWVFHFKSNPSTTGKRHDGYIRFFKPRYHNVTPLDRVPVEVGCTCEDYRYRFAFNNKQKGAGQVGPNSVSQCINRAPVITSPSGRPGLCKHLLAAARFIYGNYGRYVARGMDPERAIATIAAKSRSVNISGRAINTADTARTAARRIGQPPIHRQATVMKATPVVLGRRRQLESTAAIVSGMNTLLEEVEELEIAGTADGSEQLLTEIRDLVKQLVDRACDGAEPDSAEPSSEGERDPLIPDDATKVELTA